MNVHELKRPMTIDQVLAEISDLSIRMKDFGGGGKFDLDVWRYLELGNCLQYVDHQLKVHQAILKDLSPPLLKWVEPGVQGAIKTYSAKISNARLAYPRPASMPVDAE